MLDTIQHYDQISKAASGEVSSLRSELEVAKQRTVLAESETKHAFRRIEDLRKFSEDERQVTLTVLLCDSKFTFITCTELHSNSLIDKRDRMPKFLGLFEASLFALTK